MGVGCSSSRPTQAEEVWTVAGSVKSGDGETPRQVTDTMEVLKASPPIPRFGDDETLQRAPTFSRFPSWRRRFRGSRQRARQRISFQSLMVPSASAVANLVPGLTPVDIEREAKIPWRDLRLGRMLGSGANGTVYMATYARSSVAVKVLRQRVGKDFSDDELSKLLAECRLMLKLRHPNVLTTFGLASDGASSKQGIVMELMSHSLSELLADDLSRPRRRLHWEGSGGAGGAAADGDSGVLLGIASEVAEAMSYLHGCDIVHRDLKPANILISPAPHGRHLLAKVSDFGTSRQLESLGDDTPPDASLAVEMTVIGTPAYVAPEVLQGTAYGVPADVWSFGAILVHMACRAPPYTERLQAGLSHLELMRLVSCGELHPVASLPAAAPTDWPASVRELARRCTDVDARRRPAFEDIVITLSEMAPPSATPPQYPRSQRSDRWGYGGLSRWSERMSGRRSERSSGPRSARHDSNASQSSTAAPPATAAPHSSTAGSTRAPSHAPPRGSDEGDGGAPAAQPPAAAPAPATRVRHRGAHRRTGSMPTVLQPGADVVAVVMAAHQRPSRPPLLRLPSHAKANDLDPSSAELPGGVLRRRGSSI